MTVHDIPLDCQNGTVQGWGREAVAPDFVETEALSVAVCTFPGQGVLDVVSVSLFDKSFGQGCCGPHNQTVVHLSNEHSNPEGSHSFVERLSWNELLLHPLLLLIQLS
jgi:hypothetical protein